MQQWPATARPNQAVLARPVWRGLASRRSLAVLAKRAARKEVEVGAEESGAARRKRTAVRIVAAGPTVPAGQTAAAGPTEAVGRTEAAEWTVAAG